MHGRRTFVIVLTLFLALGLVGITFMIAAAQGGEDETLREILKERGLSGEDLSEIEKLELLDEASQPAPAAPQESGGPDAFGYTYVDSNEAGGPAYEWVELSGTGAASVPFEDESLHGPFAFGFDFDFYGEVYSSTWLSSNGLLGIGHDAPGSTDSSNDCPLPTTLGNENLIGGIWDDLDSATGTPNGAGYYQAYGAGSCPYGSYAGACFIAQWDGMYHFESDPADDVTFEMILFDDNDILIQIQDAGSEAGAESTTGIENADGSIGLTYGSCNTGGHISDTLAILYQYPPEAPNLINSTMTGPTAIARSSPLTYTLYLSNTGFAPADGALLTDTIPAGTAYVPGSVSCSSGSCTYDGAAQAINWTGSIGVEQTVTVSFAVVLGDAACNSVIANSATLAHPEGIHSPVTLTHETTAWDNFFFASDFESDDGGFVANTPPGAWAWGDLVPSADAPPAAHSGSKVWATNLSGVIPEEPSDHYLTRTFSLPPLEDGAFIWWDWWDEDGLDTGSVSIEATEVYSIEFNQHAWQEHVVNIGAYSGQTVDVVFHYAAFGVETSGAGWYVDDVVVAACQPPQIDVAPPSLAVAQTPDQVSTETLTVANTGGRPLTWVLEEAPADSCSSPADIPWLSAAPTSGSLDAGESEAVGVTFDATGLTPGSYSGSLCFTSNDPANPLLRVPVSMTVQESFLYLPLVTKP